MLTRRDRVRVRARIDRHVRARLFPIAGGCRGCGMPLRDWTPGCKTCVNRHFNWRRRGTGETSDALRAQVAVFSEQLLIDGRAASYLRRPRSEPWQFVEAAA